MNLDGSATESSKNIVLKVRKSFLKLVLITLPLFITLNLIKGFVPDTKQMATLYVLPKVMNTVTEKDVLKRIPDQIIKLTDSWITELSPEKVIQDTTQ
jgi:hypothetical protein